LESIEDVKMTEFDYRNMNVEMKSLPRTKSDVDLVHMLSSTPSNAMWDIGNRAMSQNPPV